MEATSLKPMANVQSLSLLHTCTTVYYSLQPDMSSIKVQSNASDLSVLIHSLFSSKGSWSVIS